jgi:hypothetical protein
VIAAAETALLDAAELQRCAAVAAIEMQDTNLAALVAEDDEIFAERAFAARQVTELAQKTERLPEAALVFAARRSRSDLRQE